MLELIQVDVAVGGFLLLEKADWKINPGQRVGLVGRNGAGKSTLLKTIIGQHPLESGRIVVRPDLQPGYLPQHAVSGSARTLWEETSSGMVRMIRLREELEIAEAAAREGRPKAEARLERALEAWRLAGGPSAEERVGEVLHGLGFVRTDWERPCASFSGGWQMRIALAKLLLAEPDLLLLDEPTNHLDLHARAWLSKFLARYPHAVVLVSHDRHLLDEATTHTAELVEGRLEVYGGGFSFWVHNRAERRAQQKAAWEGQQEEIARIQRFIERFRYSATKASQAQSRIKSLERMDRVEEVEEEFIPHLRLPVSDLAMPEPLELRKAQIGWPGGPALLTGLDLILARGMRLAILGPNGAGKSTLLRALAGDLPLQAGRRIQGKGVRIGVYHQDLTKELPAESAAVDVVLESWPLAQPQAARAALGALGLSGEPAFRKIGALSGGEKARVALACLTLRPVEVLLLDEPTNHLDVVTVEVLVQALAAWEGAMLFITHDRYLVEKVATHVAHTDGQNWRIHEGVRPDDFEPLALQRLIEGGGDSGEGATSYADRKKQARDRDRLRKRVVKIGEEIEAAEGQLAQVDASLCTPGIDHRRAQQLSAERSALETKIQALYAEWEQSEAQLAV